MRTFPTSFRWIHIGPDGDVEPYGGGPEVRGGGPGAAVAQQARPPWRRVGCSPCNAPTTPTASRIALHCQRACIDARGADAWTFAMHWVRAVSSAMQPVCVRRPRAAAAAELWAACKQGLVSATRTRASATSQLPKWPECCCCCRLKWPEAMWVQYEEQASSGSSAISGRAIRYMMWQEMNLKRNVPTWLWYKSWFAFIGTAIKGWDWGLMIQKVTTTQRRPTMFLRNRAAV